MRAPPALPLLLLLAACGTAMAPPVSSGPVRESASDTARVPVESAENSASAQLRQLFADDWEFRMRENPLSATFYGDHRFNDRLPSVTVADQARRAEQTRGFLERLARIDRSVLPAEERVSYDIYRRLREEDLAEFRFREYLMPITNREGFHTSFVELGERVPLNTVRDYENYVARLRGFREYARQHVELMRQGVREGLVLPAVVLQGVEETIRPHVVDDPTKSLLWKPFASFPASVPEGERARLATAGRDAIQGSVAPGYREFLEFMTREYVPAARAGIGASELPEGRAYYESRVRRYTTLDVTPEQVHQTGLAEVARIRAEMEAVIRRTGFRGSFQEFVRFLRTDPRFYARTPEELLQRTSLVLKRMDGELPRLFGRLPRMPYGIREIPAYLAPRTTTAYYSRPAGDGTRSGTYWVNTYDLPSRPLYEIEALSLHEAVPGHHLQIALQQELEDIPPFRRFTGFTAFTEGWGLYAERLGLESGFYTDPYSDFGRLTYEMWRACRLVVDTGMHYKGWTRQQAIDFMAENSALTLLNIRNEVDRYIAWPGQALAYKTGEMKIRELRAFAERELGTRFDVRRFHDVVLGSGAVPLTVLEENVRAYVAREKGVAQ
ncbi:MAG TPA: DUF885 domain-containing protein [Longimicrobiaceae bacterium]|nr:DUF885 domain-containing protein [Longimicrobiaceae bacterium]